jgi:HEAT repeat protein
MRAIYWKVSTFVSMGTATVLMIRVWTTRLPSYGGGHGADRIQEAPPLFSDSPSWFGGLLAPSPSAHTSRREDPRSKLAAARSIRAQCEAFTEMAEAGDDELTPTLIDFASKPGGGRLCAIGALAKVKSGAARSWLGDLLHDADAQVQLAAVDAIASREGDPEARSILFDAAHEGSKEVRTRALIALGNLHEEGAAPLLVDAIRSGDPQSQADLVAALGKTHDPTSVPVLAELARTGSFDGRKAAMVALGSVGGPVAASTLADMLKSGGSADATAAIQALAENNDPGAEKALVEAASDARADVAEAALRSLADRDGEEVRDVMDRALGSNDPKIVGGATAYFATHKDERAVSQLFDIAKRGDGASPEAVSALGAIGGDSARSALVEVAGRPGRGQALALRQLAEDPVGKEQARRVALRLVSEGGQCANNAIDTLAEDGSEEARDALVRVTHEGGAFASQAVNALARRGDSESMRALRDAVSSKDVGMRAQALVALGASGRPEAGSILEGAVRDRDPGVRSAALQALAELGGPVAERAITDTAKSHDASSRILAVHALAHESVPNAAATLETLARDPDSTVARDALRALADAAPARALPLVQDAMRSGDRAARMTALSVAGSLDAEPQAGILLSGVRDSDPVIVRHAAEQLARIGGHRAESALVDLLTGSDTPDPTKKVAADALSQMGGDGAVRFRDLISRYDEAPEPDSEEEDESAPE